MRPIDADALIADLDKGLWGKDWDKALAEAIIREAPSIDICFCHGCKHWSKYRTNGNESYCEMLCGYTGGDKYCAWGERKGNE